MVTTRYFRIRFMTTLYQLYSMQQAIRNGSYESCGGCLFSNVMAVAARVSPAEAPARPAARKSRRDERGGLRMGTTPFPSAFTGYLENPAIDDSRLV